MRHLVLSIGDHLSRSALGPVYRAAGRAIDLLGVKVSGFEYVEKYVRSTRNIPTEAAIPDLGKANFVAPNATVVGAVSLGKDSSVWYGAVLRGDVHPIVVGEKSVIQDLATLKSYAGPIKVGRQVFIGANARVGSCTIQDYGFVSMGATVEDGAVVESYGLLAGGARLASGSKVGSGEVWAGNPAVFLRSVTTEERENLTDSLSELRSLAKVHFEETEKGFVEVFKDDLRREDDLYIDEPEMHHKRLSELGYGETMHDIPEIELVHGYDYINFDPRPSTEVKTWKPFTEDGQVFPDAWRKHSEDYSRFERAKEIFDKPTPEAIIPSYDELPRDSTPWTKRY